MRHRLITAALVVPCVAVATVGARRTESRAASAQGDTLRLYYMGYPIGRERWSISPNDHGSLYAADFDYVDRGRRTHLSSAARLAADGGIERIEVMRLSDTASHRDAAAEQAGRAVIVERNGVTDTVRVPATWFAIAGTSPVSQHMLLVRYWLAHGRPAQLAVVPGGPTNDVEIVERGRDTVVAAAHRSILRRFAVHGVVWGWESVWLDEDDRLAGYTTAGGGGLILEAVRLALEPALSQLRASATKDRMAELRQLTAAVRPMASGTVALDGATVIDGTGAPAIRDAVVVVADGKVTAVGARGRVTVPPGARHVSAVGKTIMPGLWDMHTHLMQWEWAPVYMAAGVTTVRDMGNVLDFILPFRAAVESGGALGPTMLLAGLVDGGGPNAFGAVNAATPDEGRAVVRRYHDLGFEQIKLYSLLTPAVVAAICREAHALGMTVTGHVPNALSLLATVDSGQDQIAHMPIRGEPASDSVRQLIDSLAAHHTVIDPTASWGELLGHSTAEPVKTFQPGVDHLPPVLAQRIRAMGATVDTATAHARMARTLAIVGMLHRAGVTIVPGTDEGVPGFSVYREVELYARAGMSAMDALRAATAVSARAMGLQARTGTIEPGKTADLIVLDGNPLDDVANVRRVRLVMKRGVLYRTADIWRAAGFTPQD
ncbi:MAG: amidohydrolase family protein [Gemmatimonadaceae bacterium]